MQWKVVLFVHRWRLWKRLHQTVRAIATRDEHLNIRDELQLTQGEETNRQQKKTEMVLLQNQQLCQELATHRRQGRDHAEKIRRLSQQLCQAHDAHRTLKRQQMVDRERIEQQDRLLRQAREEATANDERHQEELNRLYDKLKALQTGPYSWVKSNFRDVAKLVSSNGQTGFPHSSSQRRACIHFTIASFIHACIFVPHQFGIETIQADQFLAGVEANVRQNCSEATHNTWRMATSIAIEAGSRGHCEKAMNLIVGQVNAQFSTFSSTNDETRTCQLVNLLRKCVGFKIALSRLKQTFVFHCSPMGTRYSQQSMVFGGGDGETTGVVRWSLWPAIMKQVDEGSEVLEPELVWTMGDGERPHSDFRNNHEVIEG
ncbi:uncharacterized protein BP01DRAFT_422855 [Aspergillus saccharolyticus JOP 1030-1]|uniref:Uncharacterized protein n=1 Tax=Aspergillus saccharolyticus JOP 1030-1 TaxID=1450539 RepID=A0A318ZH96_9EURO|nr:hypothetical protein BP01DRAFT_422855 [Aspergillus saccharolyticus JOP 1030-1]PYH46335.1 hypothetical protein BP01DRAFT_422855 [Aspergillus saccharolyticus JOP 1030-1]